MRNLRRSRKVLAAILLAVTAIVALPPLTKTPDAAAHPLGNFTINRYSRIEFAPQGVSLRYVLDMAEIPAFQERQAIDANGDGELSADEQEAYARAKAADVAGNLELEIGGKAAVVGVAGKSVSFPSGVGGLDTLRFVVDYTAPMPAGWERRALSVEYRDRNYAERSGWSEIVVRSQDGVALVGSTAPIQDVTDELRVYPGDGITNPLRVTAASLSVEPGPGTATAVTAASRAVSGPAERNNNRFTSLVTSDELSIPFILGAMAIAFAFGALHALGPGHGKTIVGAYLVGARGTARHAVLLGFLVTATHTSAVFALAFVTLYASQFIVPEHLYPWLSITSGLLVVGLGLVLLVSRARAFLNKRAHARAREGVEAHEHDHGHTHEVPQKISWRALAVLGISGGILPCPSALVVLLGAISLHRVGLGLLLVVGFSAGLAMALTTIGLVFVWVGRLVSRSQSMASQRLVPGLALAGKLAPALPGLSASIVTAIGIVMTLRAVQ